MNVLIISPSLDPEKNVSGISSVVKTFIENGHSNYTHYILGSTDARKETKDIKWIIGMFKSFSEYASHLKKKDFDLVHMNVPCDTKGIIREYIIYRINKYYGKRMIVHLHGGEYLMKRPSNKMVLSFFRKLLNKSDKVIVLSEIEKEKLAELYGFNRANVLVNSIEITDTQKIFNKRKDEKINVLYLGRIHESKGVEDIMEAFGKLYPEYPFKFTLCGAGPEQEAFVGFCRELMKDDFSYEGVVGGEKKRNVIFDSDVFILPSRYGEGLPMALLESMSVGVIPVVTNDASMKYIIKDHVNGVFVEKYNPDDLYVKMKHLFDDRLQMEQISKNARLTIEEEFDIKKTILKLEKIYNNCTESDKVS